MILNADLPKDLTAIPAGHGELQRVVVGVLLQDTQADKSDMSMDEGTQHRGKKRRESMKGTLS